MERRMLSCALAVCALGLLAGCSRTRGHYVPHSEFAYPNSNVEPLGPVKAEISKTGYPPSIALEDVRKVYNDALAQVGGANILINFKEDTTWSYVPLPFFPTTLTYRLEGTAARMEVGNQEIK